MKHFFGPFGATLLAVAGCAVAFCQGNSGGQPDVTFLEKIQHRTNPNAPQQAPTAGSTGSIRPTIGYHGGKLVPLPDVYFIWYGNWNQGNGTDTPGGQQILRDLIYGLSNSPYFKINTSFTTGPYSVSGTINFTPSTNEYTVGGSNYSTSLSDSDILAIVGNSIGSGKLPYDANGVYFVLTSSDVDESSGFCSQYCGWHFWGNTTAGQYVRYSFVGNAARCLSACAIQTVGPNGNAGVDGMASVVTHELEEVVTDADHTAWYNGPGSESADMCAWTFGHSQTQLASGAYYNMTLPASSTTTRHFEIQRQLSSGSKCYINWVTQAQ